MTEIRMLKRASCRLLAGPVDACQARLEQGQSAQVVAAAPGHSDGAVCGRTSNTGFARYIPPI